MPTKRFIPLSSELGGYLKTFIIIWIIWFVILFIALGCGKWAFYGGISVGLIFTVPSFLVILFLTGVKE